jgi:hypothetical protein
MNNMTTYEAAARLGLSPSHMTRLAAAAAA